MWKSLIKTIFMVIALFLIAFLGIYWLEKINAIPTDITSRLITKFLFQKSEIVPTSVTNNLLFLDQIRLNKKEEQLLTQQLEISRQTQLLEEKSIKLFETEDLIATAQTELEEQENFINQNSNYLENKNIKVRQVVSSLINMPPVNAVAILVTFDDELMIDVLSTTDQIAEEEGKSSITSVWLSLMSAERAGKVQNKLVNSR